MRGGAGGRSNNAEVKADAQVSARPPQEARRKSQMETEQSNNRKFAKNSNAQTKELTMVQSDKTVKDTPAIDHKGKKNKAGA